MAKAGFVMKATWHRAQVELIGSPHWRDRGSFSVYADYDLANWTFGLLFGLDGHWTEVVLQFGPLGLTVIYWRPKIQESVGTDDLKASASHAEYLREDLSGEVE